jgi:hypothetical protein
LRCDKYHFFDDENTILDLLSTHKPHDTQALPFSDISGICLVFSGHLAPTLPIIAFRSD